MIDGKPAVFISYSEAFKEAVALPFRGFLAPLGLHGVLVAEEPIPRDSEWDPEAKVAHYLDVSTMFVAFATPDSRAEGGEVFTRPNIVDEIRAARERPHLRHRIQIFKSPEVRLPSNLNPTREPLDLDHLDRTFETFEAQARTYGVLPPRPAEAAPAGSFAAPEASDGDGAQTADEGAGGAAISALEGLAAVLAGRSEEDLGPLAARAHLAASTALAGVRNAEQLGAHEVNGLYREREGVEPSPREQEHLLASLLENLTADNTPGWYWLRGMEEGEICARITSVAVSGEDSPRRMAIRLLGKLKVRPSAGELRSIVRAALGTEVEDQALEAPRQPRHPN